MSPAGRLPEDLLWRDVGWEINRSLGRLSGGRAGMLLLGQLSHEAIRRLVELGLKVK